MSRKEDRKEDELELIMVSLRHHEEYRIKIFGFFVTITGALLAFVSSSKGSDGEYIFVYLFAFIATIFGLLNEARSTQIADKYRLAAIEVERALGYTEILQVHEGIMNEIRDKKLVLRFIYHMFYILTLVIWGLLFLGVR